VTLAVLEIRGEPEPTPEPTRAQRLSDSMRLVMHDRYELDPQEVYRPPMDKRFSLPGGEELDYLPAPDLQRIAGYLIGECSELEHLTRQSVIYLWKRKGGTYQGQGVMGKCVKMSGLGKYFSEAIWVVWLAADHLVDLEITRRQVEALLHHELLHAGESEPDDDGTTKPVVEGHDFDGFGLNVQRFGTWFAPLQLAAKAFVEGGKQLALFEGGGDDEGEEAE
jgi:hypothetical protein